MYKVLLVDDEILVREAISGKIEWNKIGFELVGDCENGQAAMEYLKENPVDVVLTDICMPYMDGMELSKFIYENFPHIVIVIFSGFSDFEYAKQAIQYKVAEYILKPVTASELTDVLGGIHQKLDSQRTQEARIDKLQRVYHSYTKNEAIIISKALSRLIKGTQSVETSLAELNDLNIKLSGKYYRVVTTDIDIYSEYSYADEELKQESALMSFVVENISHEILENYGAGIAWGDSDSRVCMLLWTDMRNRFQKESIDICHEIQQTVLDTMNLSVSIGIGCYVDSLTELPKSFEAASDILRYRYTKGTGLVLDCEEACAHSANIMELERDFAEIEEAIKNKQSNELYDTLDHIQSWICHGFQIKSQAVSYAHEIMRIIYKTVSRANDQFQAADEEMKEIADTRNFQDAMDIVRAYAQKGLDAMNTAAQSSGERQAMRAMEYIKENFWNCDLGLNDVCAYLNISTSRFSSVFKEETGKTFIEVLNNVRMERAKQLLRETSMKNYEIAEKVGFSDPHYFSIAFKKTTGKTPKEYARDIKN